MTTREDPSTGPRMRQVPAIPRGTVIDHLPTSVTLKVVELVANPDDEVLVGVNFRSELLERKGVVKITGRELGPADLGRVALLAPMATVSIIRDYKVLSKGQISIPEAFIGLARCPNPNCVTNHEECTSHFRVLKRPGFRVRCIYCERSFDADELAVV